MAVHRAAPPKPMGVSETRLLELLKTRGSFVGDAGQLVAYLQVELGMHQGNAWKAVAGLLARDLIVYQDERFQVRRRRSRRAA